MKKVTCFLAKRAAVIFLALLALNTGCGSNRPEPGKVVARVGESYLTRDQVAFLTPENLSGQEREYFIKRIVEQWIENQTLARMAREAGVELTEREQWQIANMESEMLATRFLNAKMKTRFSVTDREIEDYYKSNQEQFRRNFDEVHLIHLYFEKLDKAIVREIRQSKSLLEVIKKNYLDRQINPIVEPNGDLGYVVVDHLRPKFKYAIRGTKTGLIYGPVSTEDGYHYLQVIDRQPAGSVRDLELVKDEVVRHLQIAKRHQAVKALKEKIRKEYEVETFYKNIL